MKIIKHYKKHNIKMEDVVFECDTEISNDNIEKTLNDIIKRTTFEVYTDGSVHPTFEVVNY